ncbi:MAG: phosphoribosylglycinamide formyltransferase [Xanthomonadales bacterium]
MAEPLRATVLISGTGSNLQALIDARDAGRLDLDITHVISNVAGAQGLERAARAGIRSSVLDHRSFETREDFDRALAVLMAAGDPELIILAGFMRIIGPRVLEPFAGRMINLHPSLLPLYRGTGTYQRAIDAGDRRHGASIHFVTAELDGGPVLSQVVIPILETDDAARLAARLGPKEHELIVASVELMTRRRVTCDGNQIRVDGEPLQRPYLLQDDGRLDDRA